MNRELKELQLRISSLSNGELLRIVHIDSSDYQEEATPVTSEAN